MALILDRQRHKPSDEPVRQPAAGLDLTQDIQRENFETSLPDDRLNSKTGSIVSHIKKRLLQLKSLKNKF